jgi:glycosyltransferase involved in cell wall biosynthesis
MRVIRQLRRVEGDRPIVSYAHIGFPDSVWGPRSIPHGGSVKYRYLDKSFPHAGLTCNILYVVSSGRYIAVWALLKKARHLGIHVVWNQNGAFFPSAYGETMARKGNVAMGRQLRLASYVFYQSQFAKKGSDHFLGACECPNEILYNAVDTFKFVPATSRRRKELTLLVCGSHNDSYRLPLALDVFETLVKRGLSARLKIAGRMSQVTEREIKGRVESAGMLNLVQFLGEYRQDEAPSIYQSADMLLHTQYNDVCPSVVLEAMACGLPVVYSKTGGTPELVGKDAGCGVNSELNWHVPQPPDATALTEAVLQLSGRLTEVGHAARQRAVDKFGMEDWLERHTHVFCRLLEKRDD